MQKVLVTGATGFIGYEVARILAEEGLRPRLLVRRMLRGGLLCHLDAELAAGDLMSPDSLKRAVHGVDTVIHLGARASFEPYRYVKPSIVDGSAALMQAAGEAGVSCFVYSSSLLVYSGQQQPIDETTPANPLSDYGRAKLQSEQRLTRMAQSAHMAFCALRLSHIYGARDLLFEKLRNGRLVTPGLGANIYAHLHVVDAARLLVEAARQRFQGVRAVGDDQPASWREFFAVIKNHYPHFQQVTVPAALAVAGAKILQAWSHLRGRQTLETPDGVRSWNLNLPVQPGMLWRDLGITPKYPTIHEGIPAVLDDCVAYRWIHPVNDHR